jgi:hypothetical protein
MLKFSSKEKAVGYIQQSWDTDGHIVEREWITPAEQSSSLNRFSLMRDWNAMKLSIWRFIVLHELRSDGYALVAAPTGLFLPRSSKPDNRPRFLTPFQQQITVAMAVRIPLPILIMFSAILIFEDENPSPSRFYHQWDGTWGEGIYLTACLVAVVMAIAAIMKLVNQGVEVRGQVFEAERAE